MPYLKLSDMPGGAKERPAPEVSLKLEIPRELIALVLAAMSKAHLKALSSMVRHQLAS